MRVLAAAAALLLATALGATAAPPVPVPLMVPGVGATASPNVTHLGTIPLDGVGISLRTVTVGKQVRAVVSGAAGLSVYDATDPARPLLMGHLPFYNWENEDVAVSPDGRTAFMTDFFGALYLHVVDISDPSLMRVVGTLTEGAHTVECADRACGYLYGSEGQTYDVRDRTRPRRVAAGSDWGTQVGVGGSGHNVTRDPSGVFLADNSSEIVLFRQVGSPLRVRAITRGGISKGTAYQHNSLWPRSGKYRSRSTTTGPLRDGELLLGEGETNFETACNSGSGAFSTWSMVGFDKGRSPRQLDVLRPVTGKPGGVDPAVNAMGCSGHWFTHKDARDGSLLIVGAWYEHGTRFLKVDPRTGKIRQVGWFQPQRGATSAAYWMGKDVVWAVDYHSGIDVLRFDEDPKKVPTARAVEASWFERLDTDPFAAALREVCSAGAKATPLQHARLHAAVVG